MSKILPKHTECDVVVIGSGAGGLSTAVTAGKCGLDVVVIEKESLFGGTTAFSGGVLWVPGTHHDTARGIDDSKDKARQYLQNETGAYYDAKAIDRYLDTGPDAIDFLEKQTEVRFIPSLYPDYHPTVPGGLELGRALTAAPYDASRLGSNLKRLRPPLQTITFMGMMFNSSNSEIEHFFNATRSMKSAFYVTKRLLSHFGEVLKFGRGVQVTSGNALTARLAKSVFDLDIPIYTDTPARKMLMESGRVCGVELGGENEGTTIRARKGVVLACGGFPHDIKRITQAYPHLQRGGEHFSPVPDCNTGDGIQLGEEAGGHFDIRLANAAAWMPVSKVKTGNGQFTAFPHLLDRYKPGVIGVLRNGKRFTNESESYHDVGAAMIESCKDQKETAAWLICDHPTIRKYGLGYVKPTPVPLGSHLSSGYLLRGNSLKELASAAGIDAEALQQTVDTYNKDARNGQDPAFGRGTTAFNRYLADAKHKPNPCVAPIETGPFYAVKIMMGDLGTFDGLTTNVDGQVLTADGSTVEGLYAVGNDRASIMGGNYPGAGITLGPAVVFGYTTARHIAAQ
ncbi:FAD-dependent oxidoreductase [Sedimenticola sp.]|uniref:FAD-dependent oxidoreductase n=1 Tax=Sedimenticola sp. TaxID=1940285 RepID=UPI003D11A8E4